MNILITGATGFLGQALSMRFATDGGEHWVTEVGRKTQREVYPQSEYSYTLKDGTKEDYGNWAFIKYRTTYCQCDLSNEEQVKKLGEYDLIYHLAANPLTDLTKTTIDKLVADNLGATLNLLKYAKKGCRFVYCSSATIYNRVDLLYGASEVCLPNPESMYGWTKLASEQLVQTFTNMGLVQGIIARLCAVVGLGSTHGVVHDLYRKYKENDIVEIIGAYPGSNKPFIHIDDAVEALVRLGMQDADHETPIYNVCNQDTVLVKDIVEIIRHDLGVQKPEHFTGATWAGDVSVVRLTNGKMDRRFGFRPKLDSREAIKKTIADYIERDKV